MTNKNISNKVEVSLYVAEVTDFHNLGVYVEGISSVDDAINLWKGIPPQRMNGLPSIGVCVHRVGQEAYMDDELDIVSGKTIDLDSLKYVSGIRNEPAAISAITELIVKLPEHEVVGEIADEFMDKAFRMRDCNFVMKNYIIPTLTSWGYTVLGSGDTYIISDEDKGDFELKFDFDWSEYVYTIDGEGPYAHSSYEFIASDIYQVVSLADRPKDVQVNEKSPLDEQIADADSKKTVSEKSKNEQERSLGD